MTTTERLALGLDLGGSSVKAAAVRLSPDGPSVLGDAVVPLPAERTPADAVDAVAQGYAGLRHQFGKPDAVGVAVPGIFDAASGRTMLLPNFPDQWRGLPFRDLVQGRLGERIVLCNDARALALAEATLGAGAGHRTVVCVTLGTGIGGGIVSDGRLVLGQGTAGEIGHQTVELDGPRCGCGNRGCVEAIAGTAALLRAAGRPSVPEVFAAERSGDARARAALDRALAAVGAGLANVYCVMAPDAFVVGGGIAGAGERVRAAIERAVRERMRLDDGAGIRVLSAALGRTSGAVGAALFASSSLPPPPSSPPPPSPVRAARPGPVRSLDRPV